MSTARLRIGEVAERTGLSLRTIRHYEEVDLAPPSARTQGGFRLYTEQDVARLEVIKRMKPLGFTLEEMRDLLTVLDELRSGGSAEASDRAALLDRLGRYRTQVDESCARLRARLDDGERFSSELAAEIDAHRVRG